MGSQAKPDLKTVIICGAVTIKSHGIPENAAGNFMGNHQVESGFQEESNQRLKGRLTLLRFRRMQHNYRSSVVSIGKILKG